MRKKMVALWLIILLAISQVFPAYAGSENGLRKDTPNYKVAFYAYDCYHMQDENGKRYGYGYDMMQDISKYLQCTFSYIGYEKSAKECEDMLRDGGVDIYTAARRTPEREAEFAFSTHPSITATTCMNVKVGNRKIVAGDYSTYEGIRIGLLKRHTYNERFKQFTQEKGFSCEILYYDTPVELSNALINDEVDALVNSYIRTPEDELTIENFGETPYFFMARKEDQALIQEIDEAIDRMNTEHPNWRDELYNEYYGSPDKNLEFTEEEEDLLKQMREDGVTVRAVMNPDANPYSWYEDGRAHGIVADLFTATAKKLGINYEIVPVSSKEEYETLISSGDVDIWMDMESYYEDEGEYKYKITDPYLTTSISVLRRRGVAGKIAKLAVIGDNIAVDEIVALTWPNVRLISLETTQECIRQILEEKVDGALMMSYTAQKLAREDTQNRLSVEIVPGAMMNLKMGINAKDDSHFYGLWQKTLTEVAEQMSAQTVQSYLETTSAPTLTAYLFDHPSYLVSVIASVWLFIFLIVLYIQTVRTKNRQLKISEQLSVALREAKDANDAKLNFFSKMSHDIRTPLNVVLGMTQIAKKYKYDSEKLDNALDSITSEGSYLLSVINSILDVNQLEHGHIELVHKPFNPEECMRESMEILRPLADKKSQNLTVSCGFKDQVVIGDPGRFSQIMVNIVSNAIKYTDLGGRIQVSLDLLEDGKTYRFTCTDNGIGMTKEYLKHIYEDYSRADNSRTSTTEGTGLGMSVVKGFTDLMHGKLSIQSEPGKGSTFIVEIPFEESSPKQRESVLKIVTEESQPQMDFNGKKVLLVEDNALNAEIAEELLTSLGFFVEWAENGKVALEKYQRSEKNEYFVIFMDMQMPVMDGVEATRQIRATEREDHEVPIIAMTANAFANDQRICMEAGMNAYITKPITIKEIEEAVNSLMTQPDALVV